MEVVAIVQTIYGTVTGAIEYINKIKGNFAQAQELYAQCTALQGVLQQLQERAPKDSELPSDLYSRLEHLSKTVQKTKDRAEKISNRHFILRSLRASHHEQKLQESVQALESAKSDLIPYIVKILEDLNAKIEEVKVMVGDLGTNQQKGMQHLEQAIERNKAAVCIQINTLQQATIAQKQLLQDMQCWMLKAFSPQGDSSDLSPQALASELDITYNKYLSTQTDLISTGQPSDGPQRSESLRARFKGVVEAVVELVQKGEMKRAAIECQKELEAADDSAPAEAQMKEALAVICEMCIDMADDWEQLRNMYVDPSDLNLDMDRRPTGADLIRGARHVYAVHDSSRNTKVALKVIELDPVGTGVDPVEVAKKQLYIMLQAERMGLTSLCSIYGWTLLPATGGTQRFGLVMKRYPLSLEEAVPEKGLPLKDAVRYACGILEGLVGLHSVPVVMNVLEPHHVLLDERNEAVLTDFGMSKKMESYTRGCSTWNQVTGTDAYMAPEQFIVYTGGSIKITPKTDIWAFAATMVYMLTGAAPFAERKYTRTIQYVAALRKGDKPSLPTGCTPLLEQLLRDCFDHDPSKRPDARRALEIVQVQELILKLSSEGVVVQQKAAATLGSLGQGNSEQAKLIAEAGGIQVLVSLLAASSERVQEAAAQALGKLSANNITIQEKVAAAGGIKALVQLLHPPSAAGGTAVQKAAAQALLELSSINSIQEQIDAAGGIEALKALAL